jgi:site-specific DNA recombinase
MKQAIIYTRISTDGKAEKNYSLAHQEEMLRKYCEVNNLQVLKHYEEYNSARNFDRPEFNRLISYAKNNQQNIDYLIVATWDRFSRNIEEANRVIKQLSDWGIEVISQERPIILITDNEASNNLHKS